MLLINAVEGSQEAEVIKLLGVHRNRQLVILIDSGSTSSFLDKRIATELKLPLVDTPITSVTVADGRKIICSYKCEKFVWKMQTHQFTFDVRVLELGGFDMILGVDWLRSHNPVLFDFMESEIFFEKDRKIISLEGIKDVAAHISLCWTEDLMAKKGVDFQTPVFCISISNPQQYEQITSTQFPAQLQQLLKAFSAIFAEPTSLPPFRSHNHAIPLLPST